MHSLDQITLLPLKPEDAWNFFSNPANLGKITPPGMNFQITSDNSDYEMYPGMIITYKVSPIFNIPVSWVTEITQVEKYQYFIDSQVSGPYKFWHHQHIFREFNGGTEMRDLLHYGMPYGAFGRLLEKSLVNRRVEYIFNFRKRKLEELFGPTG